MDPNKIEAVVNWDKPINVTEVKSFLVLLGYYKIWDNYSKLTWGKARFRFAYLWFKTYHFAHLNFNPLPIRYPSHPQPLEKHIFREK